MGHEFWIAVEGNSIVGFTVLGKTASKHRTVIYVQVAKSHEGKGIGSALLKAAIERYPESEFVVIPFEGTEEFYRRLGFQKSEQWEMRRPPSGTVRGTKY
jgi:predicted N-acetyltransferase YhbS